MARHSSHQPKLVLEVCVDSIESAWNAYLGGASRIELCSALSEGGLTPTLGTFVQLQKKRPPYSSFEIFVMLRPRRGTDFKYSEDEMQSVLYDLQEFKKLGVDGFVFGALLSSTEIDEANCQRIIEAAGNTPVTFHRAFDVLEGDPETHIATLIKLGFSRLLTSGQCANACSGSQKISQWQRSFGFGSQIEIVPGAGINVDNLQQLITETKCEEFHSSCKETTNIPMNSIIGDLERNCRTDETKVKDLVAILHANPGRTMRNIFG